MTGAEKDDPFLPQSEHADLYDEWANQNGYTTERVEMKAEIARLTAALTDERARREEAEQKTADLISTNELLIEEFRKESARATAAEIRAEAAEARLAIVGPDDEAMAETICVHCQNTGWVDDENWSWDHSDIPQERLPGSGKIRCGSWECNAPSAPTPVDEGAE